MADRSLTEYDAFQQLEQGLAKAVEACEALESHRPDQPWALVAGLLAACREKTFDVAAAGATRALDS